MEYAPQVFAYDAQRQQLYATEEEDDDDQRGEALHGVAEDEGLQQEVQGVEEGDDGDGDARQCGDAQRGGGERRDALHRQLEKAQEVERRLPLRAVAPVERYLLLPIAYPAEHALGVSLALAQQP